MLPNLLVARKVKTVVKYYMTINANLHERERAITIFLCNFILFLFFPFNVNFEHRALFILGI